VFFDMKKRKRIDHVGVYVGKDDKGVEQFAHASFSKGVRYDSMKGYYKDYYWGAARVLEY
ncbi:MAG: NlpC/P60 family protein, partial [Myxococcota bacterium]